MNNLRVIEGGGDDGEPPFEEDLSGGGAEFQGVAARMGAEFKHIAADFIAGFPQAHIVARRVRWGPYKVDLIVEGTNERRFLVLAHGGIDDKPDAGLRRTDTVKKAGFDAFQLRQQLNGMFAIILVTSHLPKRHTAASSYLADLSDVLFDVVATTGDPSGSRRLVAAFSGDPSALPDPTATWRTEPRELPMPAIWAASQNEWDYYDESEDE